MKITNHWEIACLIVFLIITLALCYWCATPVVLGAYEWPHVITSNNLQVLIAALLAYIAWQTYKINRAGLAIQKNKLRLDLFDRRLLVFQACINYAKSIMLNGLPKGEDTQAFISDSANAGFLFSKEIEQYVTEMRDKGLRLTQLSTLLTRTTTQEERERYAKEMSETDLWFHDQIENAKKKFWKYLYFSIDKTP